MAEYRVETRHSRKTLGRDASFKFQLLLARKTQSTAFTLYMKTEAERAKWNKALQEAMYDLTLNYRGKMKVTEIFFLGIL